jgi:hypothetical protein
MLGGSTSLEKAGKHCQVKGWKAHQCHGNGNMGSISGDKHNSGPEPRLLAGPKGLGGGGCSHVPELSS